MIGIIGVGDMGLPMSGHLIARGFDVVAYDVEKDRLATAAAGGAKPMSACRKWLTTPTFSWRACAPTTRWR
jgi:3-hydroxyisobutyrate dehydrogenase-like beta-hydroxyacid dehydrogenase